MMKKIQIFLVVLILFLSGYFVGYLKFNNEWINHVVIPVDFGDLCIERIDDGPERARVYYDGNIYYFRDYGDAYRWLAEKYIDDRYIVEIFNH